MKRFLLSWWTLSIATAVIVALILAVVLPIFVHPLRPFLVRLLLVMAVALVWAGFCLVRILRRRQASDAIATELAKPDATDDETRTIAARMNSALAGLRKASGRQRDYLYSRPWYMIIGPPGAGKTTALLNSGLRFPFSDSALKGVGGTRNLDFWFADEAVLVDTAGRYTSQDSDSAADAKAWRGFLGLLRKHRPLQPINGVVVALGMDELLRADRAALDAHAIAVRRRLAELRQTLEVNAPVYVMFTKADLLAGFAEFYDDLDVEGRRAVVGATLPWGRRTSVEAISGEFDALVQAVADRSAKRLQEELDVRRRSLILGFTPQVAALRARALRFLEGAFLGDDAGRAELRGFYLTSGVQEGAPLDRLLSGVAQVFDQAPTPSESRGRAYFLNRLLNEVVFAEAGLVEHDPKARARRSAMLAIGLGSIAATVLLVLVLWGVSFVQNRHYQDRLLASAVDVQTQIRQTGVDMVEVRDTDPDLEQTLSILRTLRELPGGYAERQKHGPPLMSRWGLYQWGHADEARQAYLQSLRRVMLPRLLYRQERYLQEHRADAMSVYDALKTYLMMGGLGPLDKTATKSWVENDWSAVSLAGADREDTRKQMSDHLQALLKDGDLTGAWPARKAPLDGALIDSSRQTVQTLSLSDRAYAILRSKAQGQGQAWQIGQVLSAGDGRAFANPDAVMQLSVPYFFTKEGYQKSFLAGLQTAQQDLEKDLWVLGSDADTTAVRTQIQGIRPGVAAAYAHEYIASWETVVKALQPADYFQDQTAWAAFTRTPSPLTLVLLELSKNTTFSKGGGVGQALVNKFAAADKALEGAQTVDAGQQIETYFRPLRDYVGDGKSGPLNDFVVAIKSAGTANNAANLAGGGLAGASAQGQLVTATAGLNSAAAAAPPLLLGFVASAAKGGQTAAVSSAKGAVAQSYLTDLLPSCRGVTEDRYPFFGAAPNEASVTDMLRVFGMSGQFDNFSRAQLGHLLDTAGPVWRWNAQDPVGQALDPLSAQQFEKASDLQNLLSAGLPLKVQGVGFGGAVTAAEISINGTTYRFENGSMGAKPAMWSISGGAPEAHVALFAGATEVKRFEEQGAWALFRLMDKARKENDGPTAVKATFGEGATFATLRFILPSTKNPFSRGGLWSLRCPAAL
ncbi:MAG TPA: type VI secretion system membrane subunit TssM [Caulobacteraceae bacterium]